MMISMTSNAESVSILSAPNAQDSAQNLENPRFYAPAPNSSSTRSGRSGNLRIRTPVAS